MNIRDIARIAGVGVSTVSRVINNHPDVKEQTRERVLEIIRENNYIPNNSARNLKKNNTKNIGVLIKGVFNPFFSEMLDLISKRISKAGYSMILEHHDYLSDDEMSNLISIIKEKRLQGVICLGGNFTEVKNDDFDEINVPVVLTSINHKYGKELSNFSSVSIDNEKSAYSATKYLIDCGHKNIAIILGDEYDIGISYRREAGYLKALNDNGIQFNKEYRILGNYNYRGAYDKTIKFLEDHNEVTAIFAISDIMAVGCAKAIKDKGLVVGKDISIMGFDGMDISEFYNPTITTVIQPKVEMAKISVDLLLDLMANKTENKHIILNTELIIRESTNSIIEK
ncbi:MAG: LacI family DNA-binding transcriptional regulator [Clostridium sp.]|uniref:LacI family DNA-binding transcriptional regulator n=1 Tax=Clostridium sp. TaxID=1506 RepID=UPI0025DCDE34|nr:LacI family DNA-binding transcriptional regulator [Clostridium sp.]MDY4252493.1 LacI family DNA-binding transcriptional regulator [Clostridium sp.]MDY6228947.1 LacI family DNA-binding transcriptional regulator [Clostridium sp.]